MWNTILLFLSKGIRNFLIMEVASLQYNGVALEEYQLPLVKPLVC